LEALEEMATQTATLLQRVEQAFHLSSGGSDGGQARVADGEEATAYQKMPGAQQCPPPPPWETLIEQVERSMQLADKAGETVHHLCQQWQQRYAGWQQLLEQSLKAPR
jgi:hypothetical protein